jgi:hypothetical protein
LEWETTDKDGSKKRHRFANPLNRIVNGFNERNAEHGATASLPMPEEPPEPELSPQEWAAKLNQATGYDMQIQPTNAFFEHDRSSEGHLYSGHLSHDIDEDAADFITLDDRNGDLPGQLVKELERIGKMYFEFADRVRRSSIARETKPKWRVWMLEEDSPPAPVYETDSAACADSWVLAYRGGDMNPIVVAIQDGDPVPSWLTAVRLQEGGDSLTANNLMLERMGMDGSGKAVAQ